MNFELWLFAMKHLGQNPDASKNIFDNMPAEEQEKLRKEYEESGFAS
ncbi:MAG: hypothetical protein K5682_04745 [Lachnospiraceae bacterium]|nr:hypothetical protein [Lachnospiraceae bacterium]